MRLGHNTYVLSSIPLFNKGIFMRAILFAVAALTAAPALADSFPQFHSPAPASTSYNVSTRVFGDPGPVTSSGSGLGGHSVASGNSLAQAQVGYSPTPFAAVHVENGSGSGSSSASATLTYEYYFLAGSSGSASNLVTYLATHNATGATLRGHMTLYQGDQYGTAVGSVDAGAGTLTNNCGQFYFHSGSQCGATNFAIGGKLTQVSTLGFSGIVTLRALASLSEGGSPLFGPPGFSAYIDPVIGLADDFLAQSGVNADDFTLELSPGLVNASGGTNPFGENDGDILLPPMPGVPEPATWSLMVAGFLLTGGAMRRRNRLQQQQERRSAFTTISLKAT